MNKEFTIKVQNKVDMFKAYLAATNWTLGVNSLTESEIEVLALVMYYNDVYKEIKDNQVRSDLILSNVVKKKIKEEFNIPSSKLETYLGKLRKKGIITDMLNPRFMIYPENILSLKYNFVLEVPVQKNTQMPVQETPSLEVPEYTSDIPKFEEPLNISQEWTPNYEE